MKNGRPANGASPDVHDFVHALAESVEIHGVTWSWLAREARIDERTLRRWRSGETEPSLRDIERALRVFDFDITLMGGGSAPATLMEKTQ